MDEFRVLVLVNTAVLVVILARLLICGKKHLREGFVDTASMDDKSFMIVNDSSDLEHLSVKIIKDDIRKAIADGKKEAQAYTNKARARNVTSFPNINQRITSNRSSINSLLNTKANTTTVENALKTKQKAGDCIQKNQHVWIRDKRNRCLARHDNDAKFYGCNNRPNMHIQW